MTTAPGPFPRLLADATDDDAYTWLAAVDEICRWTGAKPESASLAVHASIVRAFKDWYSKDPARDTSWAGFCEYLRTHRNPRNSRAQRALSLLTMPTTGTNIARFHGEFRRIVDSLGMADDGMMVGLYMHRLPAGLQALVLTQPPGATLSQIMDVVEHRVNADAAVHGGTPMDVDAVSFGWNDGSGSGNGI
ncbi:hypothetical protein IWQ56_001048, partial [Coemansia nantahalensis]